MGPKVAELAHAVTRDISTPYGMTIAIKQHLLSSYTYSLDVGSILSTSPLEEFLFSRKTGYCEHYATAMVIMLRTVGIPARLVTGFLPGEWNDFGHYYAVRQEDAHAWVEVWFPGSGWVTFDPTPSVLKQVPSPLLKQMGGLIDSIRLKWDRFVIHYSFYDQMTVAQGMRNQGEILRTYVSNLMAMLKGPGASEQDPGAVPASPIRWRLLGLVILCVACALGIGVWVRWRRAAFLNRELASIRLYQRMLAMLAARGVRKPSAETALEFNARVRQEYQAAGPLVQELTALYYRSRFGHESLSPSALQQAEPLLTQLASVSR
jgi:protein-glutamine gamma-glutamyltransferase